MLEFEHGQVTRSRYISVHKELQIEENIVVTAAQQCRARQGRGLDLGFDVVITAA